MISVVFAFLLALSVNSGLASVALEADIQAVLLQSPTCNVSSKTIQCGRSCGEYFVCTRRPKPLIIRHCPKAAPYCNTGIFGDYCSTQRDESRLTCNSAIYPIQCTADGYFPNPMDCSSYYVCIPENGRWSAERHQCPRNFVYDSRQRRCVPLTPRTPCTAVSCEAGNSTYRAYPNNPQYFYSCVERSINGTKIPVMHRCTSGITGNLVIFDEVQQSCKPYVCVTNNRIAAQDSVRDFFQCEYNTMAKLASCPHFYHFDSASNVCVKS